MSYEIRGNELFHEGVKLHLVGANLGTGFELQEMCPFTLGWGNRTIKEMVADMKSIGLNAVRVPVHPRVLANPLLPNPSMLKGDDRKYTRALDLLDAVLDELQNQGIRFMLDNHYLDKNGKIPHLWYDQYYSHQQWINDGKFMAMRYRGMRAFFAFDTRNEVNNNPNGGVTWGDGNKARDWKLACEEMARVIADVNPDIITVHETGGTIPGLDQMLDLNVNWAKNAISSHPYGPDVQRDWFAGAKSPDFPNNQPAEWDKIFGNAAKKVLYVAGEWGGRYGLPTSRGDYGWGRDKDRQWQDAFAKYARERGFPTFYWNYGPDSGDSGGLLMDDRQSFHLPKVKLIQSLITPYTTFLGEKTVIEEPVIEIPTVEEPVVSEGTVPTILRFFKYDHLSPDLQNVSKPFHDLAWLMYDRSFAMDKAEFAVTLRKLLEAKDAAVRACL